MQTQIDFAVPQGWHELSDKQLRFVYHLFANEFDCVAIKTICFLRWSKTSVIGKQHNGSYLLKKGDTIFEVTATELADLFPELDWLEAVPKFPVRIAKISRQKALPADLAEVPFSQFIIADNLYQGYLATQKEQLLDQLGATLYGKAIKFSPEERISIFFWFAALKEYFAQLFPDFFQPVADNSNLLGASPSSVRDSMNAQIRALTKGDVTKEEQVLALDTHRALTELNAQAREYKQLNEKTK